MENKIYIDNILRTAVLHQALVLKMWSTLPGGAQRVRQTILGNTKVLFTFLNSVNIFMNHEKAIVSKTASALAESRQWRQTALRATVIVTAVHVQCVCLNCLLKQ